MKYYNPFKHRMYKVTVEILRYDGTFDHYRTFPIKAKDGAEAEAIVHNHLVFSHEPQFRITEVTEVKEDGDDKADDREIRGNV